MRKSWLGMFSAASVALTLLCASGARAEGDAVIPGEAPAIAPDIKAPGDDKARFAAVFGKTGVEKDASVYDYRGVELAVEAINREGGLLRRPVDVVGIDNSSTAEGAREAAKQAIALDVTAVVGSESSACSLAMAPLLQKAGVPMITPVSTHPDVTMAGDYIFRCCFTDSFQGAAMANFAFKQLDVRSVVVMTDVSNEYSVELSKRFAETFTALGGKVLLKVKYGAADRDLSADLENIRKLRPQAIFLPDYAAKSCQIMSQAKRAGVGPGTGAETIFLGGDGWNPGMYKLAGWNVLNGSYFSTHWHPDIDGEASKRFVDAYRRKYGEAADIANAALAYDSTMLLATAVRHAKSLERDKIRQALARIKNFHGVTGDITFDRNGDPVNKSAVILKFEDGAVKYLSQTWKKQPVSPMRYINRNATQ